jgi:1,6-anhydro-N-acetylmuramate kinase
VPPLPALPLAEPSGLLLLGPARLPGPPEAPLLTPAEVRLVAHHAAASAILQATLTGSPLLDFLTGPAREQVDSYLRELARALASTRLTPEGPSHG